jgi:hypothetical protein
VQRDVAGDGLVFKITENAPLPAAASDDGWSGWNQWLDSRMAIERDTLVRGLSEAMAMYVGEKLRDRDLRIAKLEAKVEVLLHMLGKKAGDDAA